MILKIMRYLVVNIYALNNTFFLHSTGWRQERQHRIPGDEALDPKAKETHILKVMRQRYEALGPIKCYELSVLICFVTVIVLWFLRKPLFMAGM